MASAMDNEELMDNEEPKVEIEGEKLEDSSLASVPASDEEAQAMRIKANASGSLSIAILGTKIRCAKT